MKRYLAVPVALALLGMLTMPATAAKPKIVKLSHTHPEGEDYSLFCGKAKGKAKKKYTVIAAGPAVIDGKKKVRMNRRGKARVTFEIEAAGPYSMTLVRGGEELATESYFVPPPPLPETGPFRC